MNNDVNKIIFITPFQFTKRDAHRFGVEYLLKQRYHVEVWNICFQDTINFFSDREYISEIYSKYSSKEYIGKVLKEKNSIFIVLHPNEPLLNPLCVLRRKYLLYCGLTYYPGFDLIWSPDKSTYRKQKFAFSFKFAIKRIKRVFSSVKKTIMNVIGSKPYCIIASTKRSVKAMLPAEYLKCNIIYSHVFDYDRCIELLRTDPVIREDYILYCDSGFLGNHLEYAMAGVESEIHKHKQECFDRLEDLFNVLENYYHLPIVIAGHPHTIYDSDDFHGRTVVLENTSKLVKDAKVFVGTLSAAINFPIIFDKDCLFIKFQYFKDMIREDFTLADAFKYVFETVLRVRTLNVSDVDEIDLAIDYIGKVNANIRQDYIKKYIIDSETKEKLVIEYMEEKLDFFDKCRIN